MCDTVGAPFVFIAGPVDAWKRSAGALLDHVRSLVRGQPHVRHRAEADALAESIADGTELVVGPRGGTADLRFDSAKIVISE
jgi:hypothetical protein